MNINNYIKCHPYLTQLFEEIPEDERENMAIRQYTPNQVIIEKGSSCESLFIILNGVCDVMNELETGVTVCNYKLSQWDVTGFSEIISDVHARIATVTARTPVLVLTIPKGSLLAWFGTYPHFTKQLTFTVLNKLHVSLKVSAECKSYPLRINMISFLIHSYDLYRRNYIEHYTGSIKFLESRQLLSQFLGVDVRSVNRIIESLKNEGLISIVRGKIHISTAQYEALVEAKYIETQE